MRLALPFLLLALLGAACSRGKEAGGLVARGQMVYQNNCTACHARDPRELGPVGPALAGASLELVTDKVLRNEYPPGYKPQRDTRAMVPLAYLEPELPAIAAYLESLKK